MEPKITVGLVSGLYYGSEGCRMGLWHLAWEKFKTRKVHYIALVGGLVDGSEMKKRLSALQKAVKKDEKAAVRKEFIQKVANVLKDNIPVISGVKLYIITSPAYDGILGYEIARHLAHLRSDIFIYRAGGDRLALKQIGKMLGVYAPKKTSFRADYYDTPALRVLKDEFKRGTRGIGDFSVVGSLAASVLHPGDSIEIKRPYAVIPVLYKIVESRVAENQIGFCILSFHSDSPKEATLTTYNFKDLVSSEWSFVEAPPGSSKMQQELIETIKRQGPCTVSMLSDYTGNDRKDVGKAMKELTERRSSSSWPGVYQEESSKQYYFNAPWFEETLRYKVGKEDVKVDTFVGFGCLHAGCKHTDMRFFLDALPRMIIDNDVRYLIGAGDFVEGLKHDLAYKREVYAGPNRLGVLNYSDQQKLAAWLVGRVMITVFKSRIAKILAQKGISKMSQKEMLRHVNDALMTFVYISGNHCDWVVPMGFHSLDSFRSALKDFLIEEVEKVLAEAGVCANGLADVVKGKLFHLGQGEIFDLPSGLKSAIFHPHMSGTKTPSIRPQGMLTKCQDAEVVFGANFHTAEAVAEWGFDRGQRICMQFGTIKRRSGFEDTKLKTVDFGAGMLKVISAGKRIKTTEATFFSQPTEDLQVANIKILEEFEGWLERTN